MTLFFDAAVIALLLTGIRQFRDPKSAKFGNLTAAFALALALILVLYRHGLVDIGVVVMALLVGSIAGFALARAVDMIQVPAMVAFQHGAGGVAAFVVSLVELTRTAHPLSLVSEISGVLGLVIGSLTFSGSMIASAKLAGRMRQAPQVLPRHNLVIVASLVALTAIGAATFWLPGTLANLLYLIEILLAAGLGLLLAMRIGGADMPVLISSLNATAGLAASLCGMVIENRLLIAFGATVAASGSILTYVMCKAMNRRIGRIIFPDYSPETAPRGGEEEMTAAPVPQPAETEPLDAPEHNGEAAAALNVPDQAAEPTGSDAIALAARLLASAKSVVIIPGYGMALAKAQFKLVELASRLTRRGATVKYAIHPVAGRMPGHMNVLLAEAEVEYEDLLEMDEVNPIFAETDVALVIGACDVVNPAAIASQGTPISGMPILLAQEARHVIVCNVDNKPGYSGVPNPLYESGRTIMILGDARETTVNLIGLVDSE